MGGRSVRIFETRDRVSTCRLTARQRVEKREVDLPQRNVHGVASPVRKARESVGPAGASNGSGQSEPRNPGATVRPAVHAAAAAAAAQPAVCVDVLPEGDDLCGVGAPSRVLYASLVTHSQCLSPLHQQPPHLLSLPYTCAHPRHVCWGFLLSFCSISFFLPAFTKCVGVCVCSRLNGRSKPSLPPAAANTAKPNNVGRWRSQTPPSSSALFPCLSMHGTCHASATADSVTRPASYRRQGLLGSDCVAPVSGT